MSKITIHLPKEIKAVKTSGSVILKGSHTSNFIMQKILLDEKDLDTFGKRLKWLFTGKINLVHKK